MLSSIDVSKRMIYMTDNLFGSVNYYNDKRCWEKCLEIISFPFINGFEKKCSNSELYNFIRGKNNYKSNLEHLCNILNMKIDDKNITFEYWILLIEKLNETFNMKLSDIQYSFHLYNRIFKCDTDIKLKMFNYLFDNGLSVNGLFSCMNVLDMNIDILHKIIYNDKDLRMSNLSRAERLNIYSNTLLKNMNHMIKMRSGFDKKLDEEQTFLQCVEVPLVICNEMINDEYTCITMRENLHNSVNDDVLGVIEEYLCYRS